MKDESAEAQSKTSGRVITSVLLFWVGYLAITLVVGFATMSTIGSEVWQLTAWGFISSAGLIALSRFLMRNEKGPRTNLDLAVIPSSVGRFSFGVLIGLHAAWNFANWSAGGRAETGLLKVILEENTLELTQQVGTASHLSIFGALSVAFWFVHRRNVQRAGLASPSVKG